MKRHIAIPLTLLVALSLSLGFAQEKVFRTAFPACTVLSSLATTCAHRLDASVMQPLAAIRWTADSVEPLLAESWETEDETVWTINLRQGVTWHDGEAFTADDVVFSFNVYANPEVGSRWASKVASVAGYDEFQAGTADSLSGVEALDDYTVQITLASSNPNWMLLEQPYVVMFPEHILGDVPAAELIDHEFWTDRVGTGPFQWDRFVPGETVEVVRYDDYFLGAPVLDRIVYTNFADSASMLAAIESGELDELPYEASILPVTDIERYDGLDGVSVVPVNSGAPIFFRINHEVEGLDNLQVRQAMMHAIDRQGIVDSLFGGATTVRNSLFTQDWATGDDIEEYAYDPERARDLLAEVGYDSLSFDFVYYYGDSLSADVVTAIQAYLAEVGINVAPRLIDPATVNQMYEDGSWELGYVALGHGLDPSGAQPAVGCGSPISLSYCNERVDELFAQGLSQGDPDEREATYQEISAILNEELAGIWLWQQVRPLAFSERVTGPLEHWQEQPVILFNMPVYNEIETWDIAD